MDDEQRYPNELRKARQDAFLTREELAERASSPDQLVNPRSLERLERGEVRPRPSTARALAQFFGLDPKVLFPLGMDDGIRNAAGTTRIPESRPTRGPNRRI
jgi:transcriptional regulator with XRE-family HTH domain